MDESLAKGYAKQFFRLYMEDYESETAKTFTKDINFSEDKKSFNKYAKFRKDKLDNFILNYFIGGSTSAPFVLDTQFVVFRNKYKHYDENTIIPLVSLLVFSDRFKSKEQWESFCLEFAYYYIGEHAIKRIFERSNLIDEKNKFNHYAIISELKFIPFWASFWFLLNVLISKRELNFNFKPIIPAPNGIFLCEFELTTEDAVLQRLHVNTYVSLSMLRPSQVNFRKKLIDLSKVFESSILSFYSEADYPQLLRNQYRIDFLMAAKILLQGNNELADYDNNLFKELSDVVAFEAEFNFHFLNFKKKLTTVGYKEYMHYCQNLIKNNLFRI